MKRFTWQVRIGECTNSQSLWLDLSKLKTSRNLTKFMIWCSSIPTWMPGLLKFWLESKWKIKVYLWGLLKPHWDVSKIFSRERTPLMKELQNRKRWSWGRAGKYPQTIILWTRTWTIKVLTKSQNLMIWFLLLISQWTSSITLLRR